jgi:hypothetical protein
MTMSGEVVRIGKEAIIIYLNVVSLDCLGWTEKNQ